MFFIDYEQKVMSTLKSIIKYLEQTPEDSWGVDVVRSKDGTKDCLFGHIHRLGTSGEFNLNGKTLYGDKGGSQLWDWFENVVATTDQIYPINDGADIRYNQETPKKRVLAYLNDIINGVRMSVAKFWNELASIDFSNQEEFTRKRLELESKL